MLKFTCTVSRIIFRNNNVRHYAKSNIKAKKLSKPRANFKPSFTGPNPGVDHVTKMLKDEGIIDSLDDVDLDLLEESESDFDKVNETYNYYEMEKSKRKEKVKQSMIKQKYFYEKSVNLLTWSEKEQIRYLHKEYPEEWTLERIADSFPVTLENAKNIIKAVWKPTNQNRIERHDASALRNWRELKEGTLEGITPKMRDHFLKFSDRVIPSRKESDIEETKRLSKFNGEFTGLLQGYKEEAAKAYKTLAIENKTKTNIANVKVNTSNFIKIPDTSNSSKSQNTKVTLQELRKTIMKKIENNDKVPDIDEILVKPTENYTQNSNSSNLIDFVESFDEVGDVKAMDKFKETVEDVHDYTKRVRIPKKAWKRGATYKINDCYYDDDGTFLYRVPGMFNLPLPKVDS